MITNDMIKREFIHSTVGSGFHCISKMPECAVTRNYGGGTDYMQSHFASVPLAVEKLGERYGFVRWTIPASSTSNMPRERPIAHPVALRSTTAWLGTYSIAMLFRLSGLSSPLVRLSGSERTYL